MQKYSRGEPLATTLAFARAFAFALSFETSMQKYSRGEPLAETASPFSPNPSPTREGKGKGKGTGQGRKGQGQEDVVISFALLYTTTMEEEKRIRDSLDQRIVPWRVWGAYVSERQWGTVREDYSADGDSWNYLTHDKARSVAYRWGEDGLAGWCDCYQTLVFSLALWNGKDPILKERLFGVNPYEGNHGEDVKEHYFYLDATPTHSYMKYLYKYPQGAFPYDKLVKENQKRSTKDPEYELEDTGIFEKNRYFDVFIEYAKKSPQDTCIKIEVINRGDIPATLHVIPQLWFRNRWSWNPEKCEMPLIKMGPHNSLYADPQNLPPPDWLLNDYKFPHLYLYGQKPDDFLFTHNDTHNEKIWNVKSRTPFVKDAFHRFIIDQEMCVNPAQEGTKACFHYKNRLIPPGGSMVFLLRLTPEKLEQPLDAILKTIEERKKEADIFYNTIQNKELRKEEKSIQRKAFAGLIWTEQFYLYNVETWLHGDNPHAPPPTSRLTIRNQHWPHLHAYHILSMPDKWEYPWFAAWDIAFHCKTLSLIDLPFAKYQLKRILHYQFQHPNGQVPAYEWEFSDTNPPVHAWALWELYQKDKDIDFLETIFLDLLRNFNWWVNKVDRMGNNVFEGGFLGLDNISIFDRSKTLFGNRHFEQSDGTGWMGFFSLYMMKCALELSKVRPLFEEIATVFFEHFVNIAKAMETTKGRKIQFWDEEDGFFYDVISYPDGKHERLKVRSFVGLIPFFSIECMKEEELSHAPRFRKRLELFLAHDKELRGKCVTEISSKNYLFSLMTQEQMKKVLQKVFDPNEFFSPFGLRSLSKFHETHPFLFEETKVTYEPQESYEKVKGGNSNWRGPIWLPTNYLFLSSLKKLNRLDLKEFQLTKEIETLQNNLIRLFQDIDEHILFHEYYNPENGKGLGASHQTGWSALVANLIAEK